MLAAPDERDELLGRLRVGLQPDLSRALDRPLGQLPGFGRRVLAKLATSFLDGFDQPRGGLAAHDQHEHRVRRHIREGLLEVPELARLPAARLVDEQVAGPALETERRQCGGHRAWLDFPRIEELQPAGAPLLLGPPPRSHPPGVDLGVVVAADEVDGAHFDHGSSVSARGDRSALRADLEPMRTGGERDGAVAIRAPGGDACAPQREQGGRGRMAVGVVLPDLDRGRLGAKPGEQAREAWVGAAVMRHLHGVDVRQVQRGKRIALGVRRQEEVEAPLADDRHDRAGVGVVRRRPGRAWWW